MDMRSAQKAIKLVDMQGDKLLSFGGGSVVCTLEPFESNIQSQVYLGLASCFRVTVNPMKMNK